jgi:YfiH family protein
MKKTDTAGLIEPPNLKRAGVNAAFTTAPITIDKSCLAEMFHIPEKRVYLPVQKHTSTVHTLSTDLQPVTADAVITAEKEVLIGVKVADCVPILLYDRKRHVIGAVHAGWRGTARSITAEALKTMQKNYGSFAEDVLLATGPSIRSCCYSVGSDVNDMVNAADSRDDVSVLKNGKFFLDLSSINIHQALSMGVREVNVWQSEECTFCNHERFYSFRRDGKASGRQGGFIMMC